VALEISPQRVTSRYIGYGQITDWVTAEGAKVLLPNHEKIQQLVASLYAPPPASQDQAAAEGARIEVWNGTYRPQLALIAADQLRWQGLNVVNTRPADQPGYPQTQILVFNEKPEALNLLTQHLKVKPENIIRQPAPDQENTAVPEGSDVDLPADLRVILGADYDPCKP
jgi:hypothetical protein